MAKTKVPLYDNIKRSVTVDTEATVGAIVGVNLRYPDGTLVVLPDQDDDGQQAQFPAVYWRQVREVPDNLVKIAAMRGAGFPTRTASGDWFQRAITVGPGLLVQNGDGQTGDPKILIEPKTRQADATLSGHRAIRATGQDTANYASAMDPGHADDVLGITTAAAAAGARVEFVDGGQVVEPSWAWAPLQPIYLADDGLLTQTAPQPADGYSFSLVVGFATSPTSMVVRIEPPIYFED